MKKAHLLLLFLLIAALLAFVHERKSISNQTDPVMQFWVNATQQAQSSKLSSTEFYALHDDKGTMIDDQPFGQRLRQRVPIDSELCSSVDFDVLYNVSADNSANLILISQQSEHWFC